MSGSSYAQTLAADRRHHILLTLREVRGEANEGTVRAALRLVGHNRGVTRDVLREDAEFLRRHGLVRSEWDGETLVLCITERGVDVANGDVDVQGIARPPIA